MDDDIDPSTPRALVVAVVSAAMVLVAVVLEVVAGSAANSPAPSWSTRFVPLTWSQPLRVVWWLAVAAAALAFRLSLRRLGVRQRPWIVVLSVGPFVVLAAGVALGAEWATWH